jgi:hypothetical protein
MKSGLRISGAKNDSAKSTPGGYALLPFGPAKRSELQDGLANIHDGLFT